MNTVNLLEVEVKEDNNKHQIKTFPYFIVLPKNKNKNIKIPCSNETIAKKVLAGFQGLKGHT